MKRLQSWYRIGMGGFFFFLTLLLVIPFFSELPTLQSIRTPQIRERLVEVGGTHLYVTDTGNGDPVILIHGMGASSYSWRNVTPLLVAAGHRVIAIDLLGFGFSDRPSMTSMYSVESQARLVKQVLDTLGITKAHLVGHSYGAYVVRAVRAMGAPDEFEISLMSGGTATSNPFGEYFEYLAIPMYPLVRAALYYDFVWNFLAKKLRLSDVASKEYRRELSVSGLYTVFRGLMTNLQYLASMKYTDEPPPENIIWGEDDTIMPIALGSELHAEIGGMLHVLPGIGHLPMEEDPSLIGTLINTCSED